jgi:ABC-type antimicrobial peptide transport system permease subunit
VLLERVAASWFEHLRSPGALVVIGAAAILLAAAALASAWPAIRASRVDVIQALRAD